VTDASRAVLAAVRRQCGIDSDLGVWRTLWAAVRRRLPPVPPEDTDIAPAETATETVVPSPR
jgi:hypothetical protein